MARARKRKFVRPKIEYPPLTLRTWVPPDKRRKRKPKPKYIKPEGITQKLAISSLQKVWHFFKILNGRTFLVGHYSETHKRFKPRSNGCQTPCNCVVAVAFSKLYNMALWNSYTIDSILYKGDQLYMISVQHLENRGRTCINLCEVYASFYLYDTKITMNVKGHTYQGKLFEGFEDSPFLINVMQDFFNDNHTSGIITTQNTYMAFWTDGDGYYLFDSTEHNENSYRWKGVPGRGYAVVIKFKSVNDLVEAIHTNVNPNINSAFTLTACYIVRMVKQNTLPPQNAEVPHCPDILDQDQPPSHPTTPCREGDNEKKKKIKEFVPLVEEAEPEESVEEIDPDEEVYFSEEDENQEFAPEAASEPPSIPENKIPVERPKAESITHFSTLSDGFIGILRAYTFQGDTRFSNFKGKQSLANAVAALTMLRLYKSKYWFQRILDEVLILGENIHKLTMSELKGNTLKITTICKKISLNDKLFTPKVDEYSVVGKLQSQKDGVFDLLPALREFFKENSTCVITGPLILAIWEENGVYYMFDPNERDQKGLIIVKSLQVGSELQILDYTPGVACLMWFKNLKDLVKIYMNNVDRELKREPFIISKVEIRDYIELPQPWNQFQGIQCGKWIIRGTFNQNDRRFEKETRNVQGTAVSVYALGYSKTKHVKKWTTEDVDEVLIEGDIYYKKCLESLKESGKFVNRKLLLNEVLTRFPIESYEINVEIDDCLVNGLLDAKANDETLNLKKGLEEFFKDNDACVVTTRSITVAIWKNEEIYYYYDSHSRDENGVLVSFGTACVLRILNIADLAKAIEANLGPGKNNVFNISKVTAKIWELLDDGLSQPPLYNFSELSPTSAILRSKYHERSSEFKLNRGKQTVPMCLTAAAMLRLYPSFMWSRDIIDEVLNEGDKLYTDTMIQREETPNLPEDNDIDEVYAENCKMNFKIGLNKFSLSYETVLEGNFENDFTKLIDSFLDSPTSNDSSKKELLVTSDVYTVLTWVDEGLYYLFDPKPRDNGGQVLGKEEWSVKATFEGEGEEDGDDRDPYFVNTLGAGDGESDNQIMKSITVQATENQTRVIEKHDPLYWRAQEDADGKACAMRFITKEGLISHILENTPPTRREDIIFKLFPIKIDNRLDIKRVFDPETSGEREDAYSGDWYNFKEIDHGRWILRGTIDNNYEMFPEHNRGKQSIAMNYTCLAYIKRFALSKFKEVNVNDILKYGDRLLSATRRLEYKKLKKNKDLAFTDQEIEEYLNKYVWSIKNIVQVFCIGLEQMRVEVTPEYLIGDLLANDSEEILDVKKGLKSYFADNKHVLLEAKDLKVAIWKGVNVYFMFDPNSCGPNGVHCVNGTACITRYIELDVLVDVFLKNLGKEGSNVFKLHQIGIRIVHCPREPKPEEKEMIEIKPNYNGYNMVMSGKSILRGTLSQNDKRFDREKNVQCASIAIIALTMTLIHKASNWTKPIIDEIIIIGDELHQETLDTLGFHYNPWEGGLTVSLVNKIYKIGTLKANCELRSTDQRGIIDVKHPKILNIRQGIENFFEENTHGVIETETLTVAIWEEEDQPNVIYMFDPNPRGPAGLTFDDGVACVVTFETPKMAADHFIANITQKNKRSGEFVITPVEIVAGNFKTKPKTKPKETVCCCNKEPAVKNPSPTLKERRKLRKMAEEERDKIKAAKLAKLGKFEYYFLLTGEWILRGSKSQTWQGYSVSSRGNQDIPNCLAAFVMHRIISITNWYCKHIDQILDIGDQLYKDSYITYDPKNPKLGFKNVLRKVYMKEVVVTLTIYYPVMTSPLTQFTLEMALVNYFQQEPFGILSTNNEYVALFFKEGFYYMFIPQPKDLQGNNSEDGSACIMKFSSILGLVNRYIGNAQEAVENNLEFNITPVAIASISKCNPL